MKTKMILVLTLAACALAGARTASAFEAELDESAWQADLDAFLTVLHAEHDAPYFHTPKAEFDRAVAEYRAALRDLDRPGRVAGLARIAALVGDGHTWMPMHRLPFEGLPPGPGFSSLPVRLELFDDGLYIVGTTSRHADYLGARVIAVGGEPIDHAIARAMQLLPQDAINFSREMVAEWLMQLELLQAFGLAARTVELRLADDRALVLEPLPPGSSYDWIRSMDGGPIGQPDWQTAAAQTPLWMEPSDSHLRIVELDDAIYVQLTEIRDEPPGSLASAMMGAVTRAEALAAPAVVVDLRRCPGGDGTLNSAIVEPLAASAEINQRGRLVVLTGRGTHSAAVMLVSALARDTAAIFVGQATADRPNHHGETNIFVGPNTGLPILYASEYYQTAAPGDQRRFQAPDVAVPYTFIDYSTGRDSVLATALELVTGD